MQNRGFGGGNESVHVSFAIFLTSKVLLTVTWRYFNLLKKLGGKYEVTSINVDLL
jgi:hypothetical protein